MASDEFRPGAESASETLMYRGGDLGNGGLRLGGKCPARGGLGDDADTDGSGIHPVGTMGKPCLSMTGLTGQGMVIAAGRVLNLTA